MKCTLLAKSKSHGSAHIEGESHAKELRQADKETNADKLRQKKACKQKYIFTTQERGREAAGRVAGGASDFVYVRQRERGRERDTIYVQRDRDTERTADQENEARVSEHEKERGRARRMRERAAESGAEGKTEPTHVRELCVMSLDELFTANTLFDNRLPLEWKSETS